MEEQIISHQTQSWQKLTQGWTFTVINHDTISESTDEGIPREQFIEALKKCATPLVQESQQAPAKG